MTGRLSSPPTATSGYTCPAELLDARDAHIRQWQALDTRLSQRLERHSETLCFGAGETSDLLTALIPRAWEKIVGHVVDPVPPSVRKDSHRGKPLYYMDDPRARRLDTALLGVKPHYQNMLYPRLGKTFAHVIRWDDLVDDPVEIAA
jgi:hypothetical protein